MKLFRKCKPTGRGWMLFALAYFIGVALLAALPPAPRIVLQEKADRLAISADGQAIITSCLHGKEDGSGHVPWEERVTQVKQWRTSPVRLVRCVDLPHMEIKNVAISPDGKKAAAFYWGYPDKSGHCYEITEWTSDESSDAGVSIDSKAWEKLESMGAIYFSSSGELRGLARGKREFAVWYEFDIWDLQRKRVISSHTAPSWCMLMPEEDFPANSGKETMAMAAAIDGNWQVATGCIYPAMYWGGSLTIVDRLAITPDGATVARSSGKGMQSWVELWDSRRSTCRKLEHVHTSPVSWKGEGDEDWSPSCLEIAPGGRLLIVSSYKTDDTPTIWIAAADWLVEKLPAVKGLLQRPRNQLFLVDTTDGQLVHSFSKGQYAAFSADGGTLAVGYARRIELWDLPIRKPWAKIMTLALAPLLVVGLLKWSLCRFKRLRPL
jgi:hypothetical protein